MWTERTAEGQSLVAWLMVTVALVAWWNFFRVITPSEKFARYSSAFGIAMNALVVVTVLYFRSIHYIQ